MTTADGLVTPPGKTAAPSPALTPALSPARRRRRRSDNLRGWLYLAPFLLAFAVLVSLWTPYAHPRIAERAFVLGPWLAVDPVAELDGRPVSQWLAELDQD